MKPKEKSFGFQSVEKPGCALSTNWVSWIYEAVNYEKRVRFAHLPFPFCQLFQIHGSKFKLHPVRHLSQAFILRITHGVFFFGICKDSFNRLFSPLVQYLVFWRISCIVCQLFIVFPDMTLHSFYEVLCMCT